jgi:secreted PhoX family phosphatase
LLDLLGLARVVRHEHEQATFTAPAGLALDDEGDLYIADDGGWLRVVHPDGTIDTVP